MYAQNDRMMCSMELRYVLELPSHAVRGTVIYAIVSLHAGVALFRCGGKSGPRLGGGRDGPESHGRARFPPRTGLVEVGRASRIDVEQVETADSSTRKSENVGQDCRDMPRLDGKHTTWALVTPPRLSSAAVGSPVPAWAVDATGQNRRWWGISSRICSRKSPKWKIHG